MTRPIGWQVLAGSIGSVALLAAWWCVVRVIGWWAR